MDWFRSTSPYINANRGKTFVLALRGELVQHDNFSVLVQDIVLLQSLGIRLVLCLGANPQITENLRAAGLPVQPIGEAQILDDEGISIASATLGNLRARLEASLAQGVVGAPMKTEPLRAVSGNFVTAKPAGVIDGVDCKLHGQVRKVDAQGIATQLDAANIVIVPALAGSPSGELFSLDVEAMACAVAAKLNADKLILFNEADGVVTCDGLVRELSLDQAQALLSTQQLEQQGNVAQQLRCATEACEKGVLRTQIVSYTNASALLTELFSRDGSGTLISRDKFESIRVASIEDISSILELIEPLEQDGTLVRRSREKLEEEIHLFSVMLRDSTVVACAALYPFPGSKAGELACVATRPEYRNSGRAVKLLQHCIAQAGELGINKLFVLTTKTAHWFVENGFAECDKSDLPDERQAPYNLQRNSKILARDI